MANSLETKKDFHDHRGGTLKVLRAQISDVDQIAPLFDQYREFYKQSSDPTAAQNFLRDRLQSDESVIFFARADNGMALGFVQLFPSFSSIAMKRLWILNDLYVRPEARRQDVGRALMKQAEEFAKQSAARGLTLKTAMDNQPAQALYESLDWKRDDKFYSYMRLTDSGNSPRTEAKNSD